MLLPVLWDGTLSFQVHHLGPRHLFQGSWLAGGFQRAVKCAFTVTLVLKAHLQVSRFVPSCAEWVRSVVVYFFHGPAGGCQSALQVSG